MQIFEDPAHWDGAASHYRKSAHPFTAHYAEAALSRVDLTPDSLVLDVAAGTGALALAAARTGAQVLATDFSPGMVACIAAEAMPNVRTAVMDGQSLDLADGGFDAVFSIFGVMMFPDWRKGLAEMRRVTKPGGHGVVATWRDEGAATFLLLGQIRRKLFPHLSGMTMPEAVRVLNNPADFARELIVAGFRDPRIAAETHDYLLDVVMLEEPDSVFGMSPDWISLSASQKEQVVAEVHAMAGDRPILPIPSTALIAVAQA